ncbi:hypothetical protein NP511_05695 [Natrinema thermotolerans]|uniref:Lipoprotein n=1 Tax=Natrinema thermotolerans TaxID=121872 RepID=A0AAF0PDB6_9EURY|nr:hypothetical protein [Natrinema thermotolerans]QCC58032.1 hypothetical protein DVR14_04985 [Natrinema thermotolerans]WMT09126.1 hypothetical protein NP511_05695 [Natrinema thermotolerans]
MAVRSRRDLLCATTALLASSAGCTTESEVAQFLEDRSPTCETNCEDRDPETTVVRGPTRPVEFDKTNGVGYWSANLSILSSQPARYLVWGEQFVDDLTFADDGAGDDVAAFLRETAYDEASVAIVQLEIGTCRRVEPRAVSWSDDRLTISLCLPLYKYDVDCDADGKEWVAALVRVPDTLNPIDIGDQFDVTVPDDCGSLADAAEESNDTDGTTPGNETAAEGGET